MPNLYEYSAVELAGLIRTGAASAVEVVQAHLARIEQINPQLNALVLSDPDTVLAEAHRADQVRSSGAVLGPLHGIPFSVKDWIDAAGLPCSGGEIQHKDRRPERDATAVARLRQAGGILLGKTNVMVDNALYGRVNNPYNLAYSTTGSSSGEAALIAACGSPLGLGSDSGGSIRQPAHACGICGLKPTSGRVPLSGHFPFISALNDPRTVIGPLARRVADLALALEIIHGPDWRDPSAIPMPLENWKQVELRCLSAAFYIEHPGANPTLETATACRRAVASLAEAGVLVREDLPPRVEEASAITRQYWRRLESASPDEWVVEETPTLTGVETARHLFEWDRFRRSLTEFIGGYDLIITPAAEKPAARHTEDGGWIPYTLPYSLTGWPCVVVRAGTGPYGMPIGVQIVARPGCEDTALAAAAAVEAALGGWQPPDESRFLR